MFSLKVYQSPENFTETLFAMCAPFSFSTLQQNIWVQVYFYRSKLARRGELEHRLRCAGVKIAQDDLADTMFEFKLARLWKTCPKSASIAVSTPMSTKSYPSTPVPSLQGEDYLDNLWVDIRKTWLKFYHFFGYFIWVHQFYRVLKA